MTEPVIDLLATEWDSLGALADAVDDDRWATPSELPGWTVKDCLSHVVGIELMLLGEPAPEVAVDHLAHVTDAVNATLERWVEARRPVPAGDVVAELHAVCDRRLAALRAMTADELAAEVPSPVGVVPYAQFMEVRVFDSWMHEQDIRRPLGMPGHRQGPVVDHALGRCAAALGFVVGKRAGAPQGSCVVFDVDGPTPVSYAVLVDGRARLLDDAPTDVTVRLRLSLDAFVALSGGRWSADDARDRGQAVVEGDGALGEAVLRAMAFTP